MKRLLSVIALAACAGAKPAANGVHNYPDGRPHFQYEMRDGLPNGEGRVWYPNGELKSRGEYVNGQKHGTFTFYTDDGEFEHQAFFYKNVEVWQSRSMSERPPAELVQGLVAFSAAPPKLGSDDKSTYEVIPAPGFTLDDSPPAPYFATLDRATALDRAGLAFGFSSTEMMSLGAVRRQDVFGNYHLGTFGVYGQYSQSALLPTSADDVTGRRTFELDGTYHRSLSLGGLTARVGLVVPVGHDDADGYMASAAAAYQRPADAVASLSSTAAVRTGASLTRSFRRLVVQGDGGIDWAFGGDQHAFDALVRANGGIGVGIRSGIISVELSNTIRLSDPSRRLHAFGVGGTFWINKMWFSGTIIEGSQGVFTLSGAMGYEL